MGDIMKLALRLFIFAFVAAVLLAITNEVTKGPIEAQKLAAKMDALNKVLPGCEYEQIEYEGLAEGSVLDEIFVGRNASGEIEGYALTANPQGYGGPIPITIGVSTGGYVTQVYVGSLQETAGLGSKVGEADFMDQFIAIAADPDTLRDDVDTISGATVSSSAFVNAVNEMLVYSKETLAIAPNKGDKDAILAAAAAASGEPDEPVVTTNTYDVTGFAPFKVEIAVDDAGKIVSVTVPEHGETEGFGADLIADTAVFDALVGQDIATAQIDVRAGVTLTSNAINDALKQAAAPAEGSAQVYDVTGFAPFKVAIEVDADGKIVSVTVPENDETPGFGADLIADTAVFEALVGQDIATAQIDVKAGVTLTSNAINDALRQAAAGANGAEAAVPGDPYTVKGMNKFTLYIEAEDGKIVSVSAPEHSETPGFGADLLTDEALAALAGQELATAQIDVKAGVTLTSEAINSALRQAAAANGILIEEPAAEPETVAEETEEPAEEENAAGATVYDVTGFQPFKVEIAVDDAGKIVSVSVPENSETPGFGADLIADTAVFDALVGQDIATAQIDVKAGVTLTSNAINDALRQAAAAVPAAQPEESEEAPSAAGVIYDVTGFQPFKVEIAVDDAGKIVSVSVPENSETPGFGADLIADTAVFDALVGQDIATAQIDVKAGVTLTSNAINDALRQAAAAVPAAQPEEGEEAPTAAGVIYDVTGFQPFKVEIAVDDAGKIVSVSVPENSETPGFGADLIADTAVFDALVGQDIATAQIDVKAGVTLTSNAINDALRQAAAAFAPAAEEVSDEAGEPVETESDVDATVYEVQVMGMNSKHPFTLNISVDGNGQIVAATCPDHSETEGYGADILTDEALAVLIGQNIADAKFDVKAGVTVTSDAINKALGLVGAKVSDAASAAVCTLEVTGFQPFKVTVEVDDAGKIVSVSVPEHSETPGFGADLIADAAVFDALVGQDIATAQIDVKAGVTLTSNAINDALAQAAKEVQ